MKNPNTNCLEGTACPNCKSFGPFRIMVTTTVTVTDEGITDHGSVEWDDESFCTCVACGTQEDVSAFKAGKDV